MPVAKSYQKYTIIGEPFVENGKSYVYIYTNVDTKKKVRWYSDAQYAKMYPEEAMTKKLKPLKNILGFDNGYINIVCGESYEYKDWIKEHGGRFNNLFNWYFVSDINVEDLELPEGLTTKKVEWEKVAVNDETLKKESEIKAYLESLIYPEDESQFVGTVGERIVVEVTVEKNITLEGYYGIQHMHVMRSDDGNVFVWSTTAKDWAVGSKKNIKGTVKEHKTYRNVRQTVLTRCSEVK
jgi:hypothetical protein